MLIVQRRGSWSGFPLDAACGGYARKRGLPLSKVFRLGYLTGRLLSTRHKAGFSVELAAVPRQERVAPLSVEAVASLLSVLMSPLLDAVSGRLRFETRKVLRLGLLSS